MTDVNHEREALDQKARRLPTGEVRRGAWMPDESEPANGSLWSARPAAASEDDPGFWEREGSIL